MKHIFWNLLRDNAFYVGPHANEVAKELYSNLVFRELKKAAYLVKFDVTRH